MGTWCIVDMLHLKYTEVIGNDCDEEDVLYNCQNSAPSFGFCAEVEVLYGGPPQTTNGVSRSK